jgi:2-dehydro-3-deoxyphosphogluconate aldolase/(4S)-4-hydroxy-2-oxoglutarate aldolase
MSDPLERMRAMRVVPVIVIDDAKDALPLADALAEGGLPCAEITFRTAGAEEALRRIAAERPDIVVGAGTVLTADQARRAKDAGASFVVSPGFGPAVVDACQDLDVPIYPGVCTPTEIEMALAKGLDVVKFFPAQPIGGLAYLKAIAAPYVGVRFIPTGGVNTDNLGGYLGFDRVIACGGSWMASAEMIRAGPGDAIRDATRAAVALAGGSAA